MSWDEVVRGVAAATGTSEASVRAVVRALGDEVRDRLVREQDVRVPGLGSFEARWRAGRVVRDVASGRKRAIDGRHVAGFTPSKALRDALRDRTPQTLRHPEHQAAWRLAEALVGDIALYHASVAPRDLPAGATGEDVDARCLAAFGEAWTNARETWSARVPEEVRAVRDDLVLAARRRWGARGEAT